MQLLGMIPILILGTKKVQTSIKSAYKIHFAIIHKMRLPF